MLGRGLGVEIFVEEGVVEVGFRADRIERSSVPAADLLDEVLAEVCAFLILLRVIEMDLV